MINTAGKLLISAFIVIIIGLALIQVIADDVELVKTSSYTVLNETLSFVNSTTDVLNETVTLASNITGTLANTWLTAFTELRNQTSEIITGYCNVTFSSGALVCNSTGGSPVYAEYTYVSRLTETLAQDELVSSDALRNETSENIVGYCNVTLTTGAISCNKTHSNTGYADYVFESDTPYVRGSATKTLITLVILFFALAILAVGIGYAWKAFKDSDVI